jgi:hypothetical protein
MSKARSNPAEKYEDEIFGVIAELTERGEIDAGNGGVPTSAIKRHVTWSRNVINRTTDYLVEKGKLKRVRGIGDNRVRVSYLPAEMVDGKGLDDHECPWVGCGSVFSSEYKLKQHHVHAHGESLVEMAECEICGDEFRVRSDNTGRFCSPECHHDSMRSSVELECGYCGETYHKKPSMAHRSSYCSEQCKYDKMSEEMMGEVVELECEGCGGVFTTTPSRVGKRKNCSEECRGRSKRRDRRSCQQCGFVYQPKESDQKYCTHQCSCESQTKRGEMPFPIDPNVIVDLYEELGTVDKAYQRHRAIYGADKCLSRDAVSDILAREGVQGMSHWRMLVNSSPEDFAGGRADD